MFPEDFFVGNLDNRLNEIDESRTLPLNSLDSFEEQPLEKIYDLLNNLSTTDNKFPALVIGVEEELYVLSNSGVHNLPWTENLSWVRIPMLLMLLLVRLLDWFSLLVKEKSCY